MYLEYSVRNNERENVSQSRCSHCGVSHTTYKWFMNKRTEKGYNKPFNLRNSNNNKRNEHNGRKPNTCFRCGSDDRFITNCPKLDTSDKKFH